MGDIQLDELMFEYPLDRASLQHKLPTYKEFSELKLEPSEDPVYGKPFKHQEFIVKIMQIVDSILLMDATGSGKTGSFQHASEFFRDHPEFGINKVYMITKNVQLVEWMKESLVSVTNPIGYPDFNKSQSSINQMGRKKKLTQFLSKIGTLSSGETREVLYRMYFNTYASFVNTYHNMRNKDLIKHFSGTLLVIDEVHRILPKYVTEQDILNYAERRSSDEFNSGRNKFDDARSIHDIYLFIHWLTQNVIRMKKIYSSATPIINQLTRIQSLANILRQDKQYYMDRGEWNRIGDSEGGIKYLKDIFRGYVAYTREFDNNVVFKEEGSLLRVGNDTFIMRNLQMVPGGIQERTYNSSSCDSRATGIETAIIEGLPLGRSSSDFVDPDDPDNAGIETSGLCIDQRQISMFVYPDGSLNDVDRNWTTEETRTFSHISGRVKHVKKSGAKKIKFIAARPKFQAILADLNQLKQISVRFWFIITGLYEEDLAMRQQRMSCKSWFIYMTYVNNGIETLGMTLTAHGYTQYYMRHGVKDEMYNYKRFAIITAKTDSAERTSILSMMKSPDNYDGKLIRLLIGSSTVIEGISVYSVTRFDADPLWTDGEEYQAQTRVRRATSHIFITKMMLRSDEELNSIVDSRGPNGYAMLMARHKDPKKIVISTNFYNSYPSQLNPNQTIEARMQASSRKIGRKVGKINRSFKEIAVNCNLNIDRNIHRRDQPGTRNCDYMNCDYICEKQLSEDEFGTNINNYRILRMNENVNIILDEISKLLIIKPILNVTEVESTLGDRKEFMLNALERILSSNISTTNRFGEQGYIRVIGDLIFFSKDYEKDNYIPSTWFHSGLNIKTNLDSEQWLQLSMRSEKEVQYTTWILTNNTALPPKDVHNDLSSMSLLIYFELVVDMYLKMVDGIYFYNYEEGSRIYNRYVFIMKRLSYHYAAATEKLDGMMNELIDIDLQNINNYTYIGDVQSGMRYLFHAISVFKIKGSIRYISYENDVIVIRDNIRIYDRKYHKWTYSTSYIYRFTDILRSMRMKAMNHYVRISPFVRIVIPDDTIKYVSKKHVKEKRVIHGIVCKNDTANIAWLRSFNYYGPNDDCNTLVKSAKAMGKLIYT